jgi:uncharacterized membrane protein YhaH (DUF805 family)
MQVLFPRYLKRLSFFIRFVVGITLCMIIKWGVFWKVHELNEDRPHSTFYTLEWLCNVVFTTYILIWIIAPRLRDMARTPWLALLSLIPIVNFIFFLFLVFTPGKSVWTSTKKPLTTSV